MQEAKERSTDRSKNAESEICFMISEEYLRYP